MKTLTILAAAAALVAGMAVANAQSSMGKDKSMGASSAQIIGTNKYCVKTKSGTLNCNYASLSSCRSAALGAACVANPKSSTTGSKQ